MQVSMRTHRTSGKLLCALPLLQLKHVYVCVCVSPRSIAAASRDLHKVLELKPEHKTASKEVRAVYAHLRQHTQCTQYAVLRRRSVNNVYTCVHTHHAASQFH